MNKSLFVFGIALLFTSCLGYYPKGIFTPTKEGYKPDCAGNTAEVQLLFDGEPVSFEYERIGIIEIQGEYTGNETDQLKSLKALAQSKCCDAVIGIKKSYVKREVGLVVSNEPNQTYNAVSFSGVAVKKKVK